MGSATSGNAAVPRTEEQDVYAKLEKLDSLREQGILTDEEFNVEKQKLLQSQ